MKKFLLLFGFLCLGMVNVNAQNENQVRWIRGCVYDNSGNPIEGAEITFWATIPLELSYGASYSGSDGVYQIDLPDGGVNLDGEFFWSSHLTCEIEGYVTSEVYNLWKNPVDEYGIMTIDFVLQKEEANGDDVGVPVGEDAGLVDGIETVNTGEKAGKHYSVSGVEIAPNAKGLHIVNGKKVLVK